MRTLILPASDPGRRGIVLIIDIVLIAILVIALIAGVQRGALASLGVLLGLVLGGLAAFWLVPVINALWPWQGSRVLAMILLVLVLPIGGASAGGAVGIARRRSGHRSAPPRVVDRLLGGGLADVA